MVPNIIQRFLSGDYFKLSILFIGVFIVGLIFYATHVTYAQDTMSTDAATIGADPLVRAFLAPSEDVVLDTSTASPSFGDLTGFRNVIVIQAHPDDEFLMAIPLHRLAVQGADIHFYVFTHGEAARNDFTGECVVNGETVDTCMARIRRGEMRDSAAHFDGLGDGNVFVSWRNWG